MVTVQMRKNLLTLSLPKPRQKAEAILKNYDLFFMDSQIIFIIYFVRMRQNGNTQGGKFLSL